MTEPQSGDARASPVGRIPGAAGEFLTFRLGGEEYGIEILKVQEIRGYEAVTAIARAPDFIKGVINLRGVIVPIIDLRIKFQSGEADYNQFTVVILLNLGSRLVGIVVDSVSDAITLRPEQIKPAPQLASSLDTGHVTGIGSANQRKLIFVDIERLMMSSDMVLMDEVLAA